MLGFGLCLWQHNVGSQIPPYVCCRTVQRMGSTSVDFKRQVVQEYLAGDVSLHGLAKRICCNDPVWLAKYEAGEFNEEATIAASLERV